MSAAGQDALDHALEGVPLTADQLRIVAWLKGWDADVLFNVSDIISRARIVGLDRGAGLDSNPEPKAIR
ncbi:hypothetical protein [Occultella kanbiaonis]|uniref:hypothetical protein n=1 Tax=Occultella kanbiaonis TaxID=2675754 RepID=UPI0012B9D00A|nr:hypothetical protein [Occultella kanbiaonis]